MKSVLNCFLCATVWLTVLLPATDACAVASAADQDQESSQPSSAFQVHVSLEQPLESVSDAVDLRAELRSQPSSTRQYSITSAYAMFPASLIFAGRCPKWSGENPPADVNSSACLVNLLSNARDLYPGGHLAYAAHIDQASFWESPLAYLAFRSTTRNIVIHIGYTQHITDIDQPVGQIETTLQQEPQAPLTAIIAGGIFGVLLAISFGQLRKLQSAPGRRKSNAFSSLVWMFLYGSVATTVGIILLKITTVSGFPVSIKVRDAMGGLVVGLFFRPVADFIAQRLSGEPARDAAHPPPNGRDDVRKNDGPDTAPDPGAHHQESAP